MLSTGIKKGDRVVVLAGTGGGKSILSEQITQELSKRTKRILILDSKPRYNALNENASTSWWRPQATTPKRLPYGRLIKATPIDSDKALMDWWSSPKRVGLVQRDEMEVDHPWSLGWRARTLYNIADGREAWVVVDESLDFFSWNGTPSVPGKTLSQISRNGREKGLGMIVLSQRGSILPKQMLMDANVLFLGRLDGEDDVLKLHREFGVPKSVRPPEDDLNFIKLVKPYARHEQERYKLSFN